MRRPPAIDEDIARWTLTAAPELFSLRAALQQAIVGRRPAGADREDLAERLTLVTTELAGNALRHGRPPTVVLLQRADGHFIVQVLDSDGGSHPAVDDERPAGDGGLGLVLAERLSQDVGWYATGAGKRVWATFTAAGS